MPHRYNLTCPLLVWFYQCREKKTMKTVKMLLYNRIHFISRMITQLLYATERKAFNFVRPPQKKNLSRIFPIKLHILFEIVSFVENEDKKKLRHTKTNVIAGRFVYFFCAHSTIFALNAQWLCVVFYRLVCSLTLSTENGHWITSQFVLRLHPMHALCRCVWLYLMVIRSLCARYQLCYKLSISFMQWRLCDVP